jgi:hypothetical protein
MRPTPSKNRRSSDVVPETLLSVEFDRDRLLAEFRPHRPVGRGRAVQACDGLQEDSRLFAGGCPQAVGPAYFFSKRNGNAPAPIATRLRMARQESNAHVLHAMRSAEAAWALPGHASVFAVSSGAVRPGIGHGPDTAIARAILIPIPG